MDIKSGDSSCCHQGVDGRFTRELMVVSWGGTGKVKWLEVPELKLELSHSFLPKFVTLH